MASLIVKRISAAGTLQAIKVGETQVIHYKDIKTETLRNSATRLNSKGKQYVVSTDGLIERTRVSRIK